MNLISYWKYLYFEQLKSDFTDEVALEMIDEMQFYPLDKYDCIIIIPESCCYMCKTSKGFVIEYIKEISIDLADHLIKGNK